MIDDAKTIRNAMALPHGKACGDCHWFKRCQWLYQCKQYSTTCDFLPSRFVTAPASPDSTKGGDGE